MYAWQNHLVDDTGRTLPNAFVTVRDADTLEAVRVYGDAEGLIPKDNPFRSRAGFARFYAPAGRYQVTATEGAFERVYEDVALGVIAALLPDLSPLIYPLVNAAVAPILAQLDAAIAAVPTLHRFYVDDAGAGSGLPSGWNSARVSQGFYRVTHPLGGTDYHPKLTAWDVTADRVASAMLVTKTATLFEYRVRSINDVASLQDARTEIEVTTP